MHTPPFTAAGDYTRDDYFEAVTEIAKRAYRRHKKALRDMRGFVRMLPYLVALSLVLGLAVAYDVLEFTADSAILALCAMVYALGVFLYRQRRMLYLLPLESGGAYLRHYTSTIDATGLHHASVVSTSHIQWQGILLVEETRHLLLLYLDRHYALYIPKRHFADEGAWRACLEYAQEQVAAHAPEKLAAGEKR